MTYEELLIILSGIEPEEALNELRENPNHKHKSGYEFIIKKYGYFAYLYAKDVIKGRWPEAEEIIKTYPFTAYYYARDVIKGRWKEAEEYIKKDLSYAYGYARNVIGDENFWDKN